MSVKINLGCEVKDIEKGMLVENIPLKQFKYNLLISGSDANERNAVLSHILNQIYVRAPRIGVLLIKLRSNKNIHFYHFNKVYEYGDADLEVPYFLEHTFSDVNREQLINCINVLFGFHFEMKWIMRIVIKHYKLGQFPSSLLDFLEDVKKCLIDHPYDKEFTESNIRSIEKAIEFVQEDPAIERTLWIPSDLPEWLKLWNEGKKVCIDLSSCDLYYQKILVSLLFQVVRNFIPSKESDTPSGIVVIDDADQVFEESPHEYYKDIYNANKEYFNWQEEKNFFRTKEQIEEVFGDPNYLFNIQVEGVFRKTISDEFRYKNISLITVCEDIGKIYKFINSNSRIKIQL